MTNKWASKAILKTRNKLDLTQPEYEALIGVNKSHAYMMEKGMRYHGQPLTLLPGCIEADKAEEKSYGKRNLPKR